ncbi:MAG: arginine--tRNA ligase [Saprospiraceae bacterium]|nr:arginine--tRNA ligase [Saprospiraceae bacterium]
MNPLTYSFQQAFQELFDITVDASELHIQACSSEHDKDYTLILFPWVKKLNKTPEEIASLLGAKLLAQNSISGYQLVKAFFNFDVPNDYWFNLLKSTAGAQGHLPEDPEHPSKKEKILIEYCSPNTNKPLHLGHIRNILLGWSVNKILKAIGNEVETTQVINDRGVAICKSMLAWKLWSGGETPESSGIKSDHFVGRYYVLFETKFQEEYNNWLQSQSAHDIYEIKFPGTDAKEFKSKFKNEYFNTISPLGEEIRKMLLAWESNDPETLSLWKQMNQWVYTGFDHTYKRLQVSFDYTYYESQTYILGKDIIQHGLEKGTFYKESDGSTWVDLESRGLDKKILMRMDGTSVYITQDLGTASQRHERHQANKYIYVVGDEQDYHFKVLFETLRLLGLDFAEHLYHLSYGMVDLPEGKMKSREGNVVDADDLIEKVIEEARSGAEERGEIAVLSATEQESIFNKIGLAALKYFILKVHPRKRMLFDPKEAVDMQGHTGPYIVNAYVRIQSILRKQTELKSFEENAIELNRNERTLIRMVAEYGNVMRTSAKDLDPSHLANYLYQLAKEFHRYYHDYSILNADTEDLKFFRMFLSKHVSEILKQGMDCLGIEMPDRM